MKKALDLLETICVVAALAAMVVSLGIGLRHPHPGVLDIEGATLAASCLFAFLAYILKPRGKW